MVHYKVIQDASLSFTADVTRLGGLIETQGEFPTELDALDWVGERLGMDIPGEAGELDGPSPVGFTAVRVALIHRDAAEVVPEDLHTAVGQLLTREFRPPPGVTSSGKPLPVSS